MLGLIREPFSIGVLTAVFFDVRGEGLLRITVPMPLRFRFCFNLSYSLAEPFATCRARFRTASE